MRYSMVCLLVQLGVPRLDTAACGRLAGLRGSGALQTTCRASVRPAEALQCTASTPCTAYLASHICSCQLHLPSPLSSVLCPQNDPCPVTLGLCRQSRKMSIASFMALIW